MVGKILTLLAWGAVLALPACAQGPAAPLTGQREDSATPRNACQATPAVKAIVGRRATPELLENARAQAGARLLRVVGPDEMVTQEFNASRLTVLLDAQGRVAQASCG